MSITIARSTSSLTIQEFRQIITKHPFYCALFTFPVEATGTFLQCIKLVVHICALINHNFRIVIDIHL